MANEMTAEQVKKLCKQSEADFQRIVIQLARQLKWRVVHFRPGINQRGKWSTAVQGDGVGWPDLVMLRGERLLAIELKTNGKKATPAQQAWLKAFLETGAEIGLWIPDMWPEIERILA